MTNDVAQSGIALMQIYQGEKDKKTESIASTYLQWLLKTVELCQTVNSGQYRKHGKGSMVLGRGGDTRNGTPLNA